MWREKGARVRVYRRGEYTADRLADGVFLIDGWIGFPTIIVVALKMRGKEGIEGVDRSTTDAVAKSSTACAVRPKTYAGG